MPVIPYLIRDPVTFHISCAERQPFGVKGIRLAHEDQKQRLWIPHQVRHDGIGAKVKNTFMLLKTCFKPF